MRQQQSRIAMATALAAVLAAPAFAGSLKPPVMEPKVTPPAPAPVVVTTTTTDWTGGYVGADLGYNHAGTSPNVGSGNSAMGGVYAGYNYDLGNFVVGGEIGANKMNTPTGGGSHLTSTITAKVRAGYDMGSTLIYGALGAQHANGYINGRGIKGTGALVGIGLEHALNANWSVGGEADFTRLNNADKAGTRLNTTNVVARLTYRF